MKILLSSFITEYCIVSQWGYISLPHGYSFILRTLKQNSSRVTRLVRIYILTVRPYHYLAFFALLSTKQKRKAVTVWAQWAWFKQNQELEKIITYASINANKLPTSPLFTIIYLSLVTASTSFFFSWNKKLKNSYSLVETHANKVAAWKGYTKFI